jgi:hypothetical protein
MGLLALRNEISPNPSLQKRGEEAGSLQKRGEEAEGGIEGQANGC